MRIALCITIGQKSYCMHVFHVVHSPPPIWSCLPVCADHCSANRLCAINICLPTTVGNIFAFTTFAAIGFHNSALPFTYEERGVFYREQVCVTAKER